MIILAMECAAQTVGMALLDQRKVMAELQLDIGAGHAEVLLPALDKLFLLTGLTPERIDLWACTNGPGSFTGVRIGVSTIKGLAFATGKPLVGVSTLEAMAMNPFPSGRLICPLLDARKKQVYAGLYRVGTKGLPEAVAPDRLTDIESLVKERASEDVDFVGDAAVLYQDMILRKRAPGGPQQRCRSGRPSAVAVGLIALGHYENGQVQDPLGFTPRYLRLSEAEDNRARSERKGISFSAM